MAIRVWVTAAEASIASSVEGLLCWAWPSGVNTGIDGKLQWANNISALFGFNSGPLKDPANLQVSNKAVKSFCPIAQGSNV